MSQRESSSRPKIWACRYGPIGYWSPTFSRQVPLEHLGVASLVHGLCRRVVLGVDPRHRLGDLRRGQHGALFAVDELAELSLQRFDAERR